MRHVVRTSEVPHLWANKIQADARNQQGNLYFEGDTIYSYGSHFPIARHLTYNGRDCVLFTTETYSNTTSGHCSMVRGAIKPSVPVFNVIDVRILNHIGNLSRYKSEIAQLSLKAERARKPYTKEWRTREIENMVAKANQYCEFFGLDERFDSDTVRELLDKLKADTKRAEEQIRRDRAEAVDWYNRNVELWKQHKPIETGGPGRELTRGLDLPCYMRLTITGDEIETTKGAHVPIEHARKLYRIIQALRAKGETYKHNGHTIHIGQYAVDSIDAGGNLVAGCHRFEWAEIDRIGQIICGQTGQTGQTE